MPLPPFPRLLPIFPLPNVVLFPRVFLPLHIFEARYRAMVADALAGDRMIGMVLLRGGRECRPSAAPPVYPVGCAGRITHVDPLPDGRYNLVLHGIARFRIRGEDHARTYRRAEIDVMIDGSAADDPARAPATRQRLEAVLARRLGPTGSMPLVPREMGDDELVNALAQYLEFDPVEKQALLELDGHAARCAALIDLLEMQLMASAPAPGGVQ